MRDHRNLEVFSLSHNLTVEIYRLTQDYPRSELYGITSQMRRAAVSVSANIVEGAARKGRREYVRFLRISLGSLRELGYYLELSRELGLLSRERELAILKKHDHTARKLARLIQSLECLGRQR